MHDGIQEFVVEYNGMYIQAVHPDTFELLLVPFRLMRMHGGVDAHDTIQSLMTAFAEFLDIKDNAFHGIRPKDVFWIPVTMIFLLLSSLVHSRMWMTRESILLCHKGSQ